jgi:hypothetical protein
MQVVRTAAFIKSLKKLGASAEDLDRLENELAANPKAGDVIPGLGGARKIRFGLRGKGKRGGGRAIYVVIWKDDEALLCFALACLSQSRPERPVPYTVGIYKRIGEGVDRWLSGKPVLEWSRRIQILAAN